MVGPEVACLERAAEPAERADLGAVMLHGCRTEPPPAVVEPEVREELDRDAGVDNVNTLAPAGHQPVELGMSRPLGVAQEDLLAVESDMPGLS
jgi:hypothetical protein